ncbi:MAG TPA: RHS repeat domain-containing protein, partial [Longimicrobium sp.]|nr:RHS repeat domain-containing protein [Longimicrobium sp.]
VQYGFDFAGKVASFSQPLNATETAVTSIQAGEGKGFRTAVPLASAHTRLDGPRGVETGADGVAREVLDHTYVWLTRWGAPTRVRDAMGGETRLFRTDTLFKGLVTRSVSPGGLVSVAAYDASGRLDSTAVVNPLGDGRNTATRFTYDPKWSAVTSALSYSVTPGSSVRTPLGGIDSTAYDPATGNPLWQQTGDASRRVTFDYYTSGPAIGLPHHVYYPAPQPGVPGGSEEITYDASGNLHTTKSPLGFMTAHFRDALGRDTLVVTPIRADSSDTIWKLMASGARMRTGYDAAGRVWWTEALGPAVMQHQSAQGVYNGPGITPPEKLRVENTYGNGGELLTVERWSTPDSAGVGVLKNVYTYDLAGRKLTENDGSGGSGSGGLQYFGYDRAGNVTTWTTQRGHVIRTEYDALGRLTRRYVPAAPNGPSCPPLATTCARYPYYANDTDGGWTVPAEWFVYRYDAAGNQVWAENLDARVSRSYYPGGALKTDTIRMRTYEGLDYTKHVYGIEYAYDMAGRATSVRHPGNLAGSTEHTDSYGYDPVTGALATVTSRTGEVFQYGYDLHGREI